MVAGVGCPGCGRGLVAECAGMAVVGPDWRYTPVGRVTWLRRVAMWLAVGMAGGGNKQII